MLLSLFFLSSSVMVAKGEDVANGSSTCRNQCQLHDSHSGCWDEARLYYIRQLVKAANEYASVELMRARWSERHGENEERTWMDSSVVVSVVEDVSIGPLSAEDILSAVQLLRNHTVKYEDEDNLYTISCPLPCDYVNVLWIYLFVCACMVILLAFPLVLMHVYFYRRSLLKHQLTR